MYKLSDLYFGELEAFDEANNEVEYFSNTFVIPDSISISTLRKNRKFIIVGRKGVGKTALQMYFSNQLIKDGYKTVFFRFAEDMRAGDFTQLSRTQSHIAYVSSSNDRNLFLNYDFRDVWERIIVNKIAEALINAGEENDFTKFVLPQKNKLANIFSGLTKNLSIKVSGDAFGIAVGLGLEVGDGGSHGEISIGDFNRIARVLLSQCCKNLKMYFFIDELVFSRLDANADQITIKAAMVRDIIKAARELNALSVKEDLDIHFVCSLRPEIRNIMNEFDSEIGKIVDGKDVSINWYSTGSDASPLLIEVLRKKIEHSNISQSSTKIDYDAFAAKTVKFGNIANSLDEFVKTNTWGRPRDLVRLLNSVAKGSPNATRMGEKEFKSGLDEYSRTSTKELIDELSVTHGKRILPALKKTIQKKTFTSKDEFLSRMPDVGVNEDKLFDELFLLGVVGGFQPEAGNYFWAHRGESYFKEHYQVRVHPALWHEFGIRGT
ncbi:P-loop ATPase, Sll1717 family [Roseobacter sp. CCS2]|uniref:P-loop ATPase, Sll1717 family n=1 Tax=Roseobacter sp. CCS2 TaxID=391593 RepID=UPI0000F3E339|nr:ATPase [Roseobacter sp. CCS2]EBA12686.1 ATPase [Roseobacter sp. CCS2]